MKKFVPQIIALLLTVSALCAITVAFMLNGVIPALAVTAIICAILAGVIAIVNF